MKSKIKIGITGQAGFIGTHFYNMLGLFQDKYIRVPFKDEYFHNNDEIKDFVSECDVIVHLAALNRHEDPQVIYNTNIDLTNKLISACEATVSTPHIIFSSSTQENQDNPYGNSKKVCRELLVKWSKRNNAKFTGLIIPNVFGPYGKPYYNSVVATFSYQLTHQEKPEIHIDKEIGLIYVFDLIKYILQIIESPGKDNNPIWVKPTAICTVSDLLKRISLFKKDYFEQGIIPDLKDVFMRDLFNTFVTSIDVKKFYPFALKTNLDHRGNFIELIKTLGGGQISFSTTKVDVTRGNHFHTRKAERFAVISGKARIDIRRIGDDQIISFVMNGDTPSFVDMPVWYTHNITNIGDEDLYTVFWISEIYDQKDPDTFYEDV